MKPEDLHDTKLYLIEKQNAYRGFKFRFVSLVNGTRGPWNYTLEDAVADGEAHERIMRAIYGLGEREN